MQPGSVDDRERRALAAAKDVLEAAVEENGRTWEDLLAAAAKKGISETTLRRARKELGMKKEYVNRNKCIWRLRQWLEL